MQKYNKFITGKYYVYILASISFLTWLFVYLPFPNANIVKYSELVGFSILVFFFVFNALFTDKAISFLPILMFLSFVYARGLNIDEIPNYIYIDIIIAVVSIIIFAFKNKVKLRFNKMFITLLILMLAVVLGGALNEETKLIPQLILLGLCLALLMGYAFFNSALKKNNFEYLAITIHALSLILMAQIFTFYFTQENIIQALSKKSLNVGWGMNNNVAAMLLLTLPFTAYLSTKRVKFKSFFYIFFTVLEAVAIILTYSRGSIIALVIIAIPLLIGIVKNNSDKNFALLYISISIMTISVMFLILFSKNEELLTGFINSIFRRTTIHNDGRIPIYEKAWHDFKENPIFGVGLYYPLDENGIYHWYHSTFVHTMACFGSFGVVALIIHLVEKYYLILKKKNFAGFICLIAFLGSGFYGLIDVTYYSPYYMIPLLLILAVYDSSFFGGDLDEMVN